MQTNLVISAAMLITSLILAAAMAIARICFGQRRYAAIWGIGYLLYSGEIIIAGAEMIFSISRRIAEPIEFALILLPAVMVAAGARQRAGLVIHKRRMFAATVTIFVTVEVLRSLKVAPWLSITDGVFTSVMLAIAIRAISPRFRHPDPAEWVTMTTLAAFALFEMALVAADLLCRGFPHNLQIVAIYNSIYLIGLIPVFVANGIAAILLVASDLARQLRLQSQTDPLTGLLNRRGFEEAALPFLQAASQSRQSVVVVLADIDHFKLVNDRFGHAAGDSTLQYVSSQLTASCGPDALIGRVGGEEFAILLCDSLPDGALAVIDTAREAIEHNLPSDSGLQPVTVSFGVTVAQLAGYSPAKILAAALDRADAALYRSKVEGRNQVTLSESLTV